MKQKILFVGNRHFLSSILESLNGTPFILENDIDIIIAYKKRVSKKSIRKVMKRIKQWNIGFIINKLIDKIFILLNLRLFKKQISSFNKSIFPKRDLGYLDQLQNVNFLKYEGINFNNLETYDFMIVASFSLKIPKEILDKPQRGTLNVHPSCLPELRGGCPSYVQAYLKMDRCSTTIHYMDEKWDHGDIVVQKSVNIDPNATYQDRMDYSAKVAAELLNDLHKNNFEISGKPQPHSEATYCHKIVKIKSKISSFSKDDNFEGYVSANYYETMYPFTFIYYKGFIFSILKVEKIKDMHGYKHKGLFYTDGRYYFAFHGDIYLVTLFIYKGKLIASSQKTPQLGHEDFNKIENVA